MLSIDIDMSGIHESAVVEQGSRIGEGTSIWHFAHVRSGAQIGNNCNIGKSAYIDEGVIIGNNVKIQNFVSLYKGLEVEDDVFIGPSVTFTNDLYPRAFLWDGARLVKTKVAKGASIGANATVVAGIRIGEYAMVGAGSVVTKDVTGHALVFGNPASLRGYVCRCGKKLVSTDKEIRDRAFSCECGYSLQL